MKTISIEVTYLFLGRIEKRFLVEQGISSIASAEVLCSVKECSGKREIFKNISDCYISKTHRLEDDRSTLPASALLAGATMVPYQRGKWQCTNYALVQKLFSVPKAEAEELYKTFDVR